MTALDRQGWILVGFAVLFFTAIVVSVCGWILVWRVRGTPADEPPAPPRDEPPPVDEPDAPVGEPAPLVDETAPLPPGNPLR